MGLVWCGVVWLLCLGRGDGGARLDATVWYCDGMTAREEDCRVNASEAF
jgi:hypothetical protein